jgi:hypothetical protein
VLPVLARHLPADRLSSRCVVPLLRVVCPSSLWRTNTQSGRSSAACRAASMTSSVIDASEEHQAGLCKCIRHPLNRRREIPRRDMFHDVRLRCVFHGIIHPVAI